MSRSVTTANVACAVQPNGEPQPPAAPAGWQVPPSRFLSTAEVERLRETARLRAWRSRGRRRSRVREWILVELALHTGLRVFELVALRCGDVMLDGKAMASVLVRRGKGGRSRVVRVSPAFRATLTEYVDWKRGHKEPVDADAPLLCGRDAGPMHKRTAQAAVTRAYAAAGIHGHRTHDLRHTYASHLLRASAWNLRLVQKQLGHASITTTQVYADVFDPEIAKAVARLYQEDPK